MQDVSTGERGGATRAVTVRARRVRVGIICLGALTALASRPADAQDAATVHHLGRGPGGNNSYVQRYDEDFSYLRDPAKSGDFFDPLKFIPFNDAKDIYLTLNGQARFRYQQITHKSMNVASGITPGGTLVYGPSLARNNEEEDYIRQFSLGGDLHIGRHFRAYAELVNGNLSGHDVGRVIAPVYRTDLTLQNAFMEGDANIGTTLVGARIGRQEMWLGNGLFISNEPLPPVHPSFDGVRAYADWGRHRLDIGAFNSVTVKSGVLDDADNAHAQTWFAYLANQLPDFNILGSEARTGLDAIYLGFRKRGMSYLNTATSTTSAAGTVTFQTGQARTHTLALRYYGDVGNMDFDWNGALQKGSWAGYTIDAFAVFADTGYRFRELPWRPRFGLHLDVASGGVNKADKTIATYIGNPTGDGGPYWAANLAVKPTNFYDIAPHILIAPTRTLSAEFYYAWYWRYAEGDAIIGGGPGLNYIVTAASNAAGAAIARGRRIGQQPDLKVRWTPIPHITISGELAYFYVDQALKAVGGKDTMYLVGQVQFKF